MTLTLYMIPESPPVRSTLLTIHALGLQDKVKYVHVDPTKKEHVNPEYLEKNPIHSIPTLEDGDFIAWDSHAINAYLVNKYAKNDDLYPQRPKKTGFSGFHEPIRHPQSVSHPDSEQETEILRAKLAESFDMLEAILKKRTYTAGEQLTIADFSIVTSVSTAAIVFSLQEGKHQKIIAWLSRMKALPYYHVNEEGLMQLRCNYYDIFFHNRITDLDIIYPNSNKP